MKHMGMNLLMGINVDEASCFVKVLPAVDGSSVSNTQPLLELRPEARARIWNLSQVFGTESQLCNLPQQTNPNQKYKKNNPKDTHLPKPPSNSFIVRPPKKNIGCANICPKKSLHKLETSPPKHPPTKLPPLSPPKIQGLLNKRAIRASRVKRKRRIKRKPRDFSKWLYNA